MMLACNRVPTIALKTRSLAVSDPRECETAVRPILALLEIEYQRSRGSPDAPGRAASRLREVPSEPATESDRFAPGHSCRCIRPYAGLGQILSSAPSPSFPRDRSRPPLQVRAASRDRPARGQAARASLPTQANAMPGPASAMGNALTTYADARFESAHALPRRELRETSLEESRARLLNQARLQPGISDQAVAGMLVDARRRPGSRPGGKPGSLSPAPVPASSQQWTNQRAEPTARECRNSRSLSSTAACGMACSERGQAPRRDSPGEYNSTTESSPP